MRRLRSRVALNTGLLVVALCSPTSARTAGDIVVSVSPASASVGEPVEVLIRTFLPVDKSGLTLPAESPIEPYPVPSGVWNVLYPWADYPFDVVAQLSDGTEVHVPVARDPSDSTVWRGIAILPKAGSWSVWVRNFQHKEVGSTAQVLVRVEPAASSPAPALVPAPARPSIDGSRAWLIFVGLLLGLAAGLVIGRILSQARRA